MTYQHIRCLCDWPAHEANYRTGEEYKVPGFIAKVLVKGGYAEAIAGPVELVESGEIQGELWGR